MNYTQVILKFYPNIGFAIGETYESLVWHNETIEKPTEEELNAKWEEMKDEYELNLFRVERNALLKDSDLYVLPDYPHKTEEIKEKWIIYREALRNSTIDLILPTPPF